MADSGSTLPQDPNVHGVEEKGKGKAVEENVRQDDVMDDDEDSSSSEDEEEPAQATEEDGLEEIDLNNIVEGGRRTRGQVIDFAKAAEQTPADDDDDEDDDDFQPPEADEDTKMSG